MLRLAFLSMIGALILSGVPSAAAASSVAEQVVTAAAQPTPPDDGSDQDSTTTSEPAPPDDGSDQDSTTTSEPAPPKEGEDQESTTTSTDVVDDFPVRPSSSPQVRDSGIPLGSIALALLVLTGVGAGSYVLARRRPATPIPEGPPSAATAAVPPSSAVVVVADRLARNGPPVDSAAADFLIGLGKALIDAGAAVGHIESTLHTVARANGIDGVGVIVLPTALIVSVPDGDKVITDIGAASGPPLRLDQIDDVLSLVLEAETGTIRAGEGAKRLKEIRSSPGPHSPRLTLTGHVFATVGLAAILHGTWVEVVLAALLGSAVGAFRLWTRRLSSSYQPFAVLIAATAVSIAVFALSRVIDDLLTFPLVIAPLITFLPGGLLTIAVLELATGQIVSGASRLASGGLQLILLSLGIVAGSQLVGVPARELGNDPGGTAAALAPWVGVAVFGIGLVWFHGARSSARVWILLVLYVAYAGQVIGGLFFGSALSAFFGALAMTPIAVLVARQPAAPSPLVMFLPGFWLLVPGALGLDGVTRLFGAGGSAATGVLLTTATSMVGVSLGILLGLVLVASDPERPWSETP